MIVKLVRETKWRYTRMLGELKKLAIRSLRRSRVINILKEHGLEAGPKPGEGTWDDLVKRHTATL